MTRAPIIWTGAVAASLTAHAAAAAVLVWITTPDDVPEQSTPETRLQLAAFQVPRTEAAQTEPDADSLSSSAVDSPKLGQGVVPTSRADAQTPVVEQSTPLHAPGDSASALAPDADTLTETAPPVAAMAALPQPGDRVTAQAPQTEPATPQTAAPERIADVAPSVAASPAMAPSALAVVAVQTNAVLTGAQALAATTAAPIVPTALRPQETAPQPLTANAATPAAQTAAPLAPANQAVASLAPDSQTAADTPPPTQSAAEGPTNPTRVASLAPPETRASAQFAFPGQGDGPVDPVSLAAFQSFMAPGDLGSAGAEVRDSITGALSAIPCARLQARFDPDENALIMTGHVPEDSARQTVLAAMRDKMGADIPVREDLLVLPRPQCGALTGISNVGLPQSTDQITNPLLLGAGTHVREFAYSEGQALVLDIQGADYDAYVYVDFFDAAGNVVHLKPNEFRPLEFTPAEAPLRIGSPRPLNPGEPGLYIRIGPPFGQEIAVAFAASEPLYEGTRPLVEPAEPYLEWLRERVRIARETHPDFKGEWVYFFISTSAQ